MPRSISFKIPLKGIATGKTKTSYETAGFQGQACTDLAGIFQNALGTVAEEVTATNEMYDVEQRHEHLRNDGE